MPSSSETESWVVTSAKISAWSTLRSSAVSRPAARPRSPRPKRSRKKRSASGRASSWLMRSPSLALLRLLGQQQRGEICQGSKAGDVDGGEPRRARAGEVALAVVPDEDGGFGPDTEARERQRED